MWVWGDQALLKISLMFQDISIPKTQKAKVVMSKTIQEYGMPDILLLYSLYEDLAQNRALRTKYNNFSDSHCIVVFVQAPDSLTTTDYTKSYHLIDVMLF